MQTKPLSLVLAATAALSLPLAAQSTITLPNGAATTEGNSNNVFPFGSTSTTIPGLRVQHIYDSTNFTAQGVTTAVLINRIRLRANATTSTWVGGTYATGSIAMSTCPVDQSAVLINFANQQGPDYTVCYSGPISFLPGTGAGTTVIGPTVIDVSFTSPFYYDPNLGDLCIDFDHLLGANFTPNSSTGTNRVALDVQTTNSLSSRCYASTTYPTATGTSQSYGLVVTLDYSSPTGLFAAFSPSATSGPSPLTVNFTDTSFSSAPTGVTSWAWDFENDGIIDSTLRNPSYTYNTCGEFTVSLTVNDGVHAASTLTRTNLIRTDDITPDFTATLVASPGVYQLTDTSTPPATAWAWDTDGDGIDDNFTQNPTIVLPSCRNTNVRLTATRNCRTAQTTKPLFVSPNSLATLYNATNGGSSGWLVFSDLNVTNPLGITVCAIGHNTGTTTVGTPFTATVYLTEGSYVGKDNDITKWRNVATGSGIASGNNVESVTGLNSPMHLPFGTYGIAIQLVGASVRYIGTTGTPPLVVSNPDLTITTGAVRSTLFAGGSFFSVRQWNGTLHYDTFTTNSSAQYGYMGSGCAGTLPVSNQSILSRPAVGGNFNLSVNNLPSAFTLLQMGFSNTFAAGFGPLPIDLTPIGMTGCTARVSPDLSFFMLTFGTSANFSASIPNDPAFVGVLLFTQALTPDSANSFGFVLSDAAGGVIGN